MLWRFILILSLTFIAFDPQAPQLKTPAERKSDSLPQELSEAETQTILKERNPKPHVEATLKVSDGRIASALKQVRESQHKPAVENMNIYAELIIYADAYTRKLPDSQIKDRNICLKKIEQAIFKQTHAVDFTLHELPLDYRETAEKKIDQVKKIRLRAVNDLLGSGNAIKTSEE